MPLYAVNNGDTAVDDDVNQYKNVLEGAEATQFLLRQQAGADFVVRLATNNGTDKLSIQDSGGNEVASINSDGELTATLTPSVLILPAATSPSQTAVGQIVWDSDDNVLTVGDGSGRQTLVPRNVYTNYTTTPFTKNANATFSDVTGLSFPIGANEVWTFTVEMRVSTTSTPDIKYQFTGPSGIAGTGYAQSFASAAISTVAVTDWFDSNAVISGSTVIAGRLVGTMVNGSTAGTVQLQAAQNTSDASDTTIAAGAFITAWRVV